MKQSDDWHLTDSVTHELGQGDPFAAAVRATRMPMVITDPRLPDNPIVFCNQAFQDLTGYSREEIIGRNCRFLQGPETNQSDVQKIREAIKKSDSIEIDLLNYRKDQTTFWNALYLSPVRNTNGELQYFFASQLDVTDRIEAQRMIELQKIHVEQEIQERTADLKAALDAKTLLLHEVDHRVKNNLTMIGSMLRLQARSIKDPIISDKLKTMLERVDALATVHRKLYQSSDIMHFDIGDFVGTLVSDIVGSSGRNDIKIETQISSIKIPAEKASAFGLILNEIVTNSIKHAYKDGRSGTIAVHASAFNNLAKISISDDGPGFFPSDIKSDSLGHTLITRLCKQVGGDVAFVNCEPGTKVELNFSMEPQV